MDAKVRKVRYLTLDDFLGDYLLICRNCKFFNNEASEYYATAEMMEKYGKEAVELARDSIDLAAHPAAKYSSSGGGGGGGGAGAAGGAGPRDDDSVGAPSATAGGGSGAASSAAVGGGGLSITETLLAAQAAKRAAGATGATGAAAAAALSGKKRDREKAALASNSALYESFPQCSLAAPGNAATNHSLFNPTLYPQLSPAMLQQQQQAGGLGGLGGLGGGGFTHPQTLGESTNYWAAQLCPYPLHHPLSATGIAQANLLANSTTQPAQPTAKNKHKNQHSARLIPGKPKRDSQSHTKLSPEVLRKRAHDERRGTHTF